MSQGALNASPKLSPSSVDPVLEPQMRLWEGQDPNLHKLGVYPFEVEAKDLKRAVEAVKITGTPASMLVVEITKASVSILAQTKDGSLHATSSVPLAIRADIGEAPVSFEVSGCVLQSWASRRKDARISCIYDANAQTLAMNTGETEGRTSAKSRPSLRREAANVSLGQIVSGPLAAGIDFASIFLPRQSTKFVKLDGVGLEQGAVRGGYPKAVCRFRSPDLPKTLKLTIPKALSANVRSLLRRMRGRVQISDVGERMCLRGHELEVSWTKGGFWPPPSDANMFDRSYLVSCRVSSTKLALDLGFAAVIADDLRIRFEKEGDDCVITIVAHGKIGRAYSKLRAGIVNSPAAEVSTWDVAFSAKDLVLAANAMPSDTTEIRLLDRALLFVAKDDEQETSVLLNGVEAK